MEGLVLEHSKYGGRSRIPGQVEHIPEQGRADVLCCLNASIPEVGISYPL